MAARKKAKGARKKVAKKRARPAAKKARRGSGAKKKSARKKAAKRARKADTADLIVDTAQRIRQDILKKRKPDLEFPIRSLGNVSYSQKKGYFEIGKQVKTRTLTVNTVRGFAQTLRLMGLSKNLIEANDFATKRDAYYQSKNWESAKFDDQGESDTVMDDIEAMFSVHGVSREQLRFVPDEHGGAVAGRLTVLDPDLESGEIEEIDCTRFGSGAYSIPSTVEHLSFETNAKFILAVETGGIFQRLQSHKFWQSENCILVSLAGVPTRSTRRFIRKLSDECGLPVFAFVDCDPYGFSNIYRTLKVGSGNAAGYVSGDDLTEFFAQLTLWNVAERKVDFDGRTLDFAYQQSHLYSDCYVSGSMTCVDCHAPHSLSYRDPHGTPLEGRFDDRQCTGCHPAKARDPRAHHGHGPKTRCTDCHMPFRQHPSVGDRMKHSRSDHAIPVPRPFDPTVVGGTNV